MDFKEVEWGGMDSTDLAQDRAGWPALVHEVINFRVP